MHQPGTPSLTSGPIKDRDMHSPAMKATWRRVQQLHMSIQMHFLPYYVSADRRTGRRNFPKCPLILDHLGRVGQGTQTDLGNVLKLAKFPQVYMKYSGANYSSKEKYPFADVRPMVRRIYDAFGADRMVWGYFGHDRAGFEKEVDLFEIMFDHVPDADKEKIRGGTALKLFGWRK